MMADTILQYLMWAIPTGGIGYAIAWIAGRKSRRTKEIKELHDTYKVMYEDVSKALLENQKKYNETNDKIARLQEVAMDLNTENGRLHKAVNRLNRAIEAIQRCPYSAECPVLDELPDGEADCARNRYDRNGRQGRQSADKDGDRKGKTTGDGTGVKCDSDSAGGQSGGSSAGGTVPGS